MDINCYWHIKQLQKWKLSTEKNSFSKINSCHMLFLYPDVSIIPKFHYTIKIIVFFTVISSHLGLSFMSLLLKWRINYLGVGWPHIMKKKTLIIHKLPLQQQTRRCRATTSGCLPIIENLLIFTLACFRTVEFVVEMEI